MSRASQRRCELLAAAWQRRLAAEPVTGQRRADGENQFALGAAGLDASVCLRRLRERKGLADIDLQFALIEQVPAAPQDRALVGHGLLHVAQLRRQHQFQADAQVAVARLLQVEGAGVEDGHQITVDGHGRDALLEHLGADGIEGDVHAAARGPIGDGADQVLVVIVDGALGAQCVT
jgi:hypothetical protein